MVWEHEGRPASGGVDVVRHRTCCQKRASTVVCPRNGGLKGGWSEASPRSASITLYITDSGVGDGSGYSDRFVDTVYAENIKPLKVAPTRAATSPKHSNRTINLPSCTLFQVYGTLRLRTFPGLCRLGDRNVTTLGIRLPDTADVNGDADRSVAAVAAPAAAVSVVGVAKVAGPDHCARLFRVVVVRSAEGCVVLAVVLLQG
jgi:hypothetical protein